MYEEIVQKITTFNFDLNKIVEYFFKEMGYTGVAFYNDLSSDIFDWHYHQDEFLLYILEGSMRVEYTEKEISLSKGDFHVFPPKKRHRAVMGENGCRYLIAVKTGIFDTFSIY
jgi:mannose-6-phosphate isomerase-like protein (cupin superfamily)